MYLPMFPVHKILGSSPSHKNQQKINVKIKTIANKQNSKRKMLDKENNVIILKIINYI